MTNTGISAARLYWENKLGFFDIKGVTVPAAVSVFPRELYQAPRSWAERAYPRLIYFNELGKGNSHTQDNIPFILVGNGANFQMGRSLKFPKIAHNRLLLSLAHGFGHDLKSFGNPDYCGEGPLHKLT